MTLMLPNVVNIDEVLETAEIAKALPIAMSKNAGMKVALLDGDYPFDAHEVDEVFVILDGSLTMDMEGRVLTVAAGQRHRTRTDKPSKVLLVGPK